MADFLSLSVKNEHERIKQLKSNRIKSDPRRNLPQEKNGRTARTPLQKGLKRKSLAFCAPLLNKKNTLRIRRLAPSREIRMWV